MLTWFRGDRLKSNVHERRNTGTRELICLLGPLIHVSALGLGLSYFDELIGLPLELIGACRNCLVRSSGERCDVVDRQIRIAPEAFQNVGISGDVWPDNLTVVIRPAGISHGTYIRP